MKKRFTLCCVLGAIVFALPMAAQNKRPEFMEMYNTRHLKENPLIGETLEEVDIFDAKGKKFSTERFRGKYTVLVFGCLT